MSGSTTDGGTQPPKPSTIHEVARLAGVSHQTVSRYLRGNGGLKPQTITKVEDAMARLDYTPNLAARALRSRQSYRIVIVAPEGIQQFDAQRMLRSAISTAEEAGYVTDVVSVEMDASGRWDRLLRLISNERPAGIFSIIPLDSAQEQIASTSPDLPVVVVGSYDEKLHATGSLADAAPATEMIEYLASLGHRSFYHAAGPDLWTSAVNRREAYLEAIARLGLHSAGVGYGDWSIASGYRIGLEIPLEDGPVTAVFASNDHMALGVIRALHERGKKVPDDLSVFGWNDIEEARYSIPSLSTVSMDLEAPGLNGMSELIFRIRNQPPAHSGYEFTPMRLILRESASEAPAKTEPSF